MRAAVFYCMRKLTGQAVSRGAGAAGVRKDMEFGKSAAAKKVQRRGVVFIRLPGKAGDEITRQSAAREVLPKERRPRQKECGVVLAVHGFQGAVASGLQREVEMPADLACRGEAAAEVLGDDGRFQGTEPQAHVSGSCGDRFDEIGKRRGTIQVEAVRRDFDAGDHQFPEALLRKPAGFCRSVIDGHAA